MLQIGGVAPLTEEMKDLAADSFLSDKKEVGATRHPTS